jgi:hypothetical protein
MSWNQGIRPLGGLDLQNQEGCRKAAFLISGEQAHHQGIGDSRVYRLYRRQQAAFKVDSAFFP